MSPGGEVPVPPLGRVVARAGASIQSSRLFWFAVIPLAVVVGFGVAAKPLYIVAGAALLLGAALGLRYPSLLLVGIVVSLGLERWGEFETRLGPIQVTISKLAVAGALAVWALRCVARRERLMFWTPVSTGLMLVIGTMTLSIPMALVPGRSFSRLVTMVLLVVMMHLTAAVAARADLRIVTTGFVAVTLASLVYGLFFAQEQLGRVLGASGNPNLWGMHLLVLTLASVGLVHGLRSPLRWLPVAGLLLLLPYNLVDTASRGVLLVSVAVGPLVLVVFRRRWRLGIVVAAVAAIVFYATIDLEPITNRLNYGDQGSAEYSAMTREEALWIGLRLTRDHWLTGIGLDQYPLYYAQYSASGVVMDAHNMYVTMVSEQGIAGLISNGVFLGSLLVLAGRTVRLAWNGPLEAPAVGLSLALLAWLLNGVFGGFFNFTQAYLVLGLLIAVYIRVRDGPTTTTMSRAPGDAA